MFDHLNPEQKKGVLTTEGRVLILAGAGSGKTSVLTHRIAHLLRHCDVPPEAVLGLTFTNKAAQEMRERVGKLLSSSLAKKITLNTFHSFCMQVLRKEIHHLGYTSNFTLYDEKDVKRVMQTLARHLLAMEGELPSLEQTFAKIREAKIKGVCPSTLLPENPSWHDQFSCDLSQKLNVSLRAYNAVDFDSLLSLTLDLFRSHPEVLKKYQEKFRYIMIDEYQDTSPIQYEIANLLAQGQGNLCVVGDDDQSIYGWRGAEVKNILNFPADHTIRLEQNYRSTPTILQAANSVIAFNSQRHKKQLWSSSSKTSPITLFHAPTEAQEAHSVVQRMIRLRKDFNIPWSEMAILYRSNLLALPFELALKQATWERNGQWVRGIPFNVFGGLEFFEQAEIKDLIAYLRVISNPLDQEALLRIINTPRRGLSETTLDLLTQYNRSHKIPLWSLLEEIASPLSSSFKNELSEQAILGIQKFVSLISEAQNKFQKGSLKESFAWLIDAMNYKKAIADHAKSDKMRAFKWENVERCIEAVGNYEDERLQQANPEISLSDFLSTSTLDREFVPKSEKKGEEESVSLMTFHSAKGLEFTACYLIGLEDHIIPHEKSVLGTGIEEERRLMYVAITRAREHLCLSMARSRKKMGKEIATTPSRFLLEIPKELLQITSWQTIS